MGKLPNDFDWRKSPAHIDLLGKFVKPRDISQVLTWQYLRESLKENSKDAINRFIQEGALEKCELDEILNCAFTADQLKKMSREKGLKPTGSKSDLIERLISSDRKKMEEVASKLMIMKCTHKAAEFVSKYEEGKQEALEIYETEIF